jgi:hypothetical protein
MKKRALLRYLPLKGIPCFSAPNNNVISLMIKIYEIIPSTVAVIRIVHMLVWKTLKISDLDAPMTTEKSIPTVINARKKEAII